MDRAKKYCVKTALWENTKALMLHHWHEENLQRLARETKIGPGSAARIKARETSVGIDIVAKIAFYFDVEPWHLLLRKLDPENPPVVIVTDEERDLYAKFKRVREVLAQ